MLHGLINKLTENPFFFNETAPACIAALSADDALLLPSASPAADNSTWAMMREFPLPELNKICPLPQTPGGLLPAAKSLRASVRQDQSNLADAWLSIVPANATPLHGMPCIEAHYFQKSLALIKISLPMRLSDR